MRVSRPAVIFLVTALALFAACGSVPTAGVTPGRATTPGPFPSAWPFPSRINPSPSPSPNPPPASAEPSPVAGPSPSPTSFSPAPGTGPLAHLPAGSKPPFENPSLVSCSADPGPTDPVAVVIMHGGSSYVLRDYANEDQPKNVCTFGTQAIPDAILDPHHLLMVSDGFPAIVVIPSGTIYELSLQYASQYSIPADLTQILWFPLDAMSLHDAWDGHDTVLAQYPATAGRCGAPDIDSKTIEFSRDSRFGYALWEQNFGDSTYLNVVANHENVFSLAPPGGGWPAPGGPLMAVWSPSDTLYFTKLGDVWTWSSATGATDIRTGVRWIDPTISPDGKHLVYMSRDGSGTSTVHFMDPSTGASGSQIGPAGTDFPYFLTNDLVWLHADVPGCVGGQPTTYVYDLRNNTLSPSALDWVLRTWPATSALGG